MSDKLMLIDGYSLINRAFYAISGRNYLQTADGVITNAIFGFFNMLYKLLEEEKPEYILVAFDVKKPTFRHLAYDGYKLGRRKMPEELVGQIPYIRDILKVMGISIVEKEGFEADDIMGTLAKKVQRHGINSVVISGDRDLLQIVDEFIRVKVPVTKGGATSIEDYDVEGIYQKYGLTPKQLIELKSVMGDSSDNIPGVKGVGEKTALPLVQKYGSLEGIYENIHELKGALKQKFEEQRDGASLSRTLATIILDVPVDFQVEDFQVKSYDTQELCEIFGRLELKGLIEKFCPSQGHQEKVEELHIQIEEVEEPEILNRILKKAQENGAISFYSEPFFSEQLLGIYPGGDTAYLFDFKHANLDLGFLTQIFTQDGTKKFVHHLKEFIRFIRKFDYKIKSEVFDVMLAGYLIDSASQKYEVNDLATKFLGTKANQVSKKNENSFQREDVAKNAFILGRLGEIFSEKIKELGQEKLLTELEMPLVEVLESMESQGIKVNKEALKIYWDELNEIIKGLEDTIYDLAGEKFNMNSPKALGEILFEKLQLPVGKKTKTGFSTDVEVLEDLKDKHPVIESILGYRQMEKLKNTYAKPLYDLVEPLEDAKIHTKFNQAGTVTGRITSVEPNLQNIPYRQEYGRRIRKVFVPSSPDHVLIDADYSQIELRILAHITEDENLIHAFIEGKDIHARTAAKIFGIEEKDITSIQRSRAKAINFGILYGLGEFSLAKDLGVTRKEAKSYIEGYLGEYKGVQRYMVDVVEKAKAEGFVTTLLGRRRNIPELQSKNFNIRSFGERVALNAPIQGSAADVLKLAMLKIYAELKDRGFASRLVLQVHDEILVDALRQEEKEVKELVKVSMESVLKLHVPLLVEVKQGDNWYETK
jgi:DNA polymerase I